MPDIPFLSVAFLDFEASSLALDSWPIEVDLNWIDRNFEVQTYHSLIQPVPEWPEHAWSPASAVAHDIPHPTAGSGCCTRRVRGRTRAPQWPHGAIRRAFFRALLA